MTSPWKSFLSCCLKSKNTEELSLLLDCLLTIEEKKDIADRYQIIKGLLNGKLTQRDMAEKLKVSIAKITRGSNALKSMDPKIKNLFK